MPIPVQTSGYEVDVFGGVDVEDTARCNRVRKMCAAIVREGNLPGLTAEEKVALIALVAQTEVILNLATV